MSLYTHLFVLSTKILIIASWITSVILFFNYVYESLKKEKNKGFIIILLCAAGMFFIDCNIPIRSAYDSGHDFQMAEIDFFKTERFGFKEIAYSFTINITDILTGKNLKCILYQNQILSILSMILLFCTLRRLRLTFLSAVAGTVLLSFNFNYLIASCAMASAAHNVFFFLCAVSAAFFSFDNNLCRKKIIWFFSSMTVLIMSRAELTPAPMFVLIASFYTAIIKNNLKVKKFNVLDYIILSFGIFTLSLSSIIFFSFNPQDQMGDIHLKNIYHFSKYHVIKQNLAIMLGYGSNKTYDTILYILVLKFFLIGMLFFCFCGKSHIRKEYNKNFTIAFLAAFIINSLLYDDRGTYPLHFVRHTVMFCLPICFLFSFTYEGFVYVFSEKNKNFLWITIFFLTSYIFSNIQTVFSLNSEIRANDITWEFLINNQEKFSKGYYISDVMSYGHKGLINKYFNNRNSNPNIKNIVYIAPEIFSGKSRNMDFTKNFIPLKTVSILYKPFNYRNFQQVKYEMPVQFGFYKETDLSKKDMQILKQQYRIDKIIEILKIAKKDSPYDIEKKKLLVLILSQNGTDSEYLKEINEIQSSLSEIEYNELLTASANIKADKQNKIINLIRGYDHGGLVLFCEWILKIYQYPITER